MLLHCKVFNVLHTVKIKIYQNIEREREREREREHFVRENYANNGKEWQIYSKREGIRRDK